jgi:phosphatidylglycerophosphate synthase
MAEYPNAADLTTLAGAAITCVGAVNLDKRWGALVVGVGKSFDVLDGWLARRNGTDDEDGQWLDIQADRITEAAIVASLVLNDDMPAYFVPFGYGLKMANKLKKGEERSTAGNTAMTIKDLAVGAVLISTLFEKESKPRKLLNSTAKVLGWTAMAFGVKEVLS